MVETFTPGGSAYTANQGSYLCGEPVLIPFPTQHWAGLATGQDKAGECRPGLLICSDDCSWVPSKRSTHISAIQCRSGQRGFPSAHAPPLDREKMLIHTFSSSCFSQVLCLRSLVSYFLTLESRKKVMSFPC